MLIVQKYGGSSVADKERMLNVAERIAEGHRAGNKMVVVVSAHGNTTDELLKSAMDINPDASKRELDMLISTGEQQSAALMVITLASLGIPAVSLNAWQLGIFTTDNYGNARIESLSCERINSELEKGNVVIAAGFQGVNKFGDITTLGRGGSDTTAVALAAALKADKCEIYTDVEGVYTADPRVVTEAEKLSAISYDEMLDYTTMGAKVLHNRSVELAKSYGIPINVRSSFACCDGTTVFNIRDKRIVSGIASDNDTALVTITGVENRPGTACNVFRILADNHISVDIILGAKNGEIDFTVPAKDVDNAVNILKETNDIIKAENIVASEAYSKISVIGSGLESNQDVMTQVLDAVMSEGINIEMINTSEAKICMLVDEKSAEKAVRALHKRLIG